MGIRTRARCHAVLPGRTRRALAAKRELIERAAAPPNLRNRSVRHPFLTDPLRIIGARDYVSGDPFRMIDRRTTAGAGKLMVRQLEPSLTPVLDLIIDVTRPGEIWSPDDPDEVEFAISVAASVAAEALASRWAIGVRSNGGIAGSTIDRRYVES